MEAYEERDKDRKDVESVIVVSISKSFINF